MPQSPATLEPLIGRFRALDLVGQGASGVVYRGVDLHSHSEVAIKLYFPDAAPLAEREAALLSRLEGCKGVVRAIAWGRVPEEHSAFLVVEWLPGVTLRQQLAQGPLSKTQALRLGMALSNTLSFVHAHGIVHRDVKPENVFLVPAEMRGQQAEQAAFEWVPVLIDFGVASAEEDRILAGTPAYLSPEQARGESVGPESDLYSLGATLFECLTGRPPHLGPNPTASLARLLSTQAPPVSLYLPQVRRELDELFATLLARAKDARPSSATAACAVMAACLRRELEEPGPISEQSQRHLLHTTRLVSTLVATHFPSKEARSEALLELTQRGATALGLGPDALLAHFGLLWASGGEGLAALAAAARLARLGAHVGVGSGRVQVQLVGTEGQAFASGEVVDRAAHLASRSDGRAACVDEATEELGQGHYRFLRQSGYALLGEALEGGGTERSDRTPFVGRDLEMERILSLYASSRELGRSMLVSLVGPPGIGKTRLMQELVQRIRKQPEAPRILLQRREAFGRKLPLGAALELLRDLLNVQKTSTVAAVFEELTLTIPADAVGDDISNEHLVLAHSLTQTPLPKEQEKMATRDVLWLSMTRLARQVLAQTSLVIVLEDLQWADAESVAWFDHLLGQSTAHPVFLLSCVRPEFFSVHEGRFLAREHTQLTLQPIGKESIRKIAEALLPQGMQAARASEVVELSGGSPLFAEELARLFAIGREPGSAPTIEAAIQASLDTLPDTERDAVERLSVLGQTVWESGLSSLGVHTPGPILDELVRHGIFVPQETTRIRDTREFLFKHALVRDVAYASLLPDRKRELHLSAGHFFAEQSDDPALCAYHFEQADEPQKAADYWERAAFVALAANSLQGAMTMAEKALSFALDPESGFRRALCLDQALERLDPRSADRESSLSALDGFAYDEATQLLAEGARASYDDARGATHGLDDRLASISERALALGRWDEVARTGAILARRAAFRGDAQAAEREIERLLSPELAGEKGARVEAFQTRAVLFQTLGRVESAILSRQLAVESARKAGLREREAMLLTNLGFALSSVGARQEARESLLSGLDLAEAIMSPAAVRHAQMNLLGFVSLHGQDAGLDAVLSEPRQMSDGVADGDYAMSDRAALGMIYYRGAELVRGNQEGELRRARSLLELAVRSYREKGHLDVLPVALGTLAEAYRKTGSPEAARKSALEAVDLLRSGAPSLLSEASAFLALYHVGVDQGEPELIQTALSASVPALNRRLNGLRDSPYERSFLRDLPDNAELVAALSAHSLLPDEIHRVLTDSTSHDV